jgi:hypothetical protein
MSENQMIPSPPGGSLRFGEQQYPPSAPTTPPANPIRLVHSFFRGHYLVLWIMLIVLTPLGAWLGNKCGHTLYRSVGLIRVDPVGQAILFHNEENGAITMYDQFLDTEAARIRSSRVITDAMQDPAWAQVPGTLPANLSDLIAEELLVSHQSELLSVSVWDPNSKVAVTAVGAIIRAYLRIYNEENNTKEQGRMMALNDRRVNEQAEVDNYSKEILETAASNQQRLRNRRPDQRLQRQARGIVRPGKGTFRLYPADQYGDAVRQCAADRRRHHFALQCPLQRRPQAEGPIAAATEAAKPQVRRQARHRGAGQGRAASGQ